jgi:anaerobic magnesium-protoporphyrin IX monomethyl ester cyclase
MEVVLINPNYRTKLGSSEEISSILPPLGIAYIAAFLREKGIRVSIIDMNACNYTIPQTLDILKNMARFPDVIGITVTTPTVPKSFEIAEQIKKFNKDALVVFGGAHPTALPEEILRNKSVDLAVYGEGEKTMLEICRAKEKNFSFKKIKGLAFRHKGKIIKNPPRDLIPDLDSLPFPAIDLLPRDKYYSAYSKDKRFANILTSRGCPGMCIYCNKLIFGHCVRMRSAENIIKEIKYLHHKYGYREFHIVDDLFTQDRKRVIEFCSLVKKNKLKINWKLGNGVRVGSVDFELLKIMKEAGLYSLSFGIESGNQKILNNMKKGQTLEMCRNAVTWANKLGLTTVGFFMIGNLGEDESTIRETIEFAKSLPLDIAQFSILVPFPGTPIRAIIEQQGKILEKNWNKYDNIEGKALFEHGNLTKELMERMHKQAYKEFYMRPGFILRRILKTRTLSDFKKQFIGLTAILGLLKHKKN